MRKVSSGRRILIRTAGLGLLLAVSCAVAGCGGSAKVAAAPASASAGSGDPAKWTKCLRDNGIDVKDPDPGTGEIDLPSDSPALTAAMGKCKQYNSGMSGSTGANPNDPAQAALRRKFAKCMRDQGVDWPDPVAGTPMKLPAQTPEFMAAFQKCNQEVPISGGSK